MNKFFKVLGIVFATIFALGLIVYLIPQEWIDGETTEDISIVSKSDYSEDQQEFIDNFGLPNSWTVTFHQEDEAMLETWKYIELGEAITFVDGYFIDRTEFDFNVPADTVLMDARIDPKDIYSLESLDELNDWLDAEPTDLIEINEDIWENAVFYNYDDIIMAGVVDDELVYVKTQSFYLPDFGEVGEDELFEPDEFSVIPYVNETFGFSLEFPRSWEGFSADEEIYIEDGIFYITFTLPLNNGEEMPVFTIEAYYEDQSASDSLFAEPLGQNNAYYLYFSHFNGDATSDYSNVMKFVDIIPTIEVFDVEVG